MLEADIYTFLFLAAVALGAVVQTITGFALGLISMAAIATLGVADIAFSAAVISFVSLANTSMALRDDHAHVDWRTASAILAGLVPFIAIGLVLLEMLGQGNYHILELLLGIVIIVAAVSMMFQPEPFERSSKPWQLMSIGATAGLIAGFYSAGGAPIAYVMYRQPISLATIRSTMLMIFAASALLRSVMLIASGQVSLKIAGMSALALPVVLAATWLSAKYLRDHVDDKVKRLVCLILLGVGLFLTFGALF